MPSTKKYWKDLGDLHEVEELKAAREKEFASTLPVDQVLSEKSFQEANTGRRDFLKFLGFSVSAAALAACETPVIRSIPYVNKPEAITPGVANWYASTFYDGEDHASILVKTREGRPIHITGNPSFGLNYNKEAGKSVVNPRINSSVLSLYDSARLQGPTRKGENGQAPTTWKEVDAAIAKALANSNGKRNVLLTSTVISPSTKAVIEQFKTAFPGTEHVQVDATSYHGLTEANRMSFGTKAMPSYDLTQADVLVGIAADFLGTWGSTTEYTWQYAQRRKPGKMNKHWQFESRMSVTGANADSRVPVKVSEQVAVVIALHDHIAAASGGTTAGGASAEMKEATASAAKELLAAKGSSLVLCGINDQGVQTLVNNINAMLGNYGRTIDLANHTNFYQGDDAAFVQLVSDMKAGRVNALLIHGLNPAYGSPMAADVREGLAKVDLSVSFSGHADETADLCQWICPDHNYLESWNDQQPKVGHYTLTQPTISPLFSTRQWQESLMAWAGISGTYYDMMRTTWQNALGQYAAAEPFTNTWNKALHDGVLQAPISAPAEQPAFVGDVSAAATMAKKLTGGGGEFELELYQKIAIGDGRHANNPWLQELPDPLTKITWDNYICMSPTDMKQMGLQLYIGQESPASLAKLSANGIEVELPVLPAPGQRVGTVSVALGYGRGANGEQVGKAAATVSEDGTVMPVGKNVYPFASMVDGSVRLSALNATITPTGGTYPLAITQTHLTDMDRHSVVKETTQEVWSKHDPANTYNHPHELVVHEDVNGDGVIDARDKESVTKIDLWTEHPVESAGHRWGLTIDLNSCTACGACMTACQSENNVSVVGKDEVRRSREMHWLRLDRYYSSDMTKTRAEQEGLGNIDMYLAMEVPEESPKVVFMPVMCQHCNHAPCETVCPVAATTHSNEGLNQMTYNRCIGTRYCANNCPYKVRRFNWWNYVTPKFGDMNPAYSDLGRMVLNPDVVVRSRGVIEKCSMCVQRIQDGKLQAKKDGKPVEDGKIQTACSAACGNGAIVFGDLNDKGSKVREGSKDERAYHMLEEVGVKPNVSYLAKVRNLPADHDNVHEEEAHHA